MARFGLAIQTMFAELTQRCLDAEFDDTYDEDRVPSGGVRAPVMA